MAFVSNTVAQGRLPATKTTLYTSTGVESIVLEMILHNTAATSETFSIYHKKSGGTSRKIARGVLEQDETAYVVSDGEKLILGSGDEIEGNATNAAAVDYTIAGGTQ